MTATRRRWDDSCIIETILAVVLLGAIGFVTIRMQWAQQRWDELDRQAEPQLTLPEIPAPPASEHSVDEPAPVKRKVADY